MKPFVAAFSLLFLLTQTGSANFLWATKAFWLKAHKDWEVVKIQSKSPFVSEMIQLKPTKKEFAPGIPIRFEQLLIVIGDRVMAFGKNGGQVTNLDRIQRGTNRNFPLPDQNGA